MDYSEILDQISKNAKIAGEFIAEKAILAKDYTVLSGEITQLRSRINSLYKTIGKAMYAAHTTEADTAEEIEQHLAELDVLHQSLLEKEQQRKHLSE